MIEKIATEKAPAALGPYTQAIKVGNTLYISGLLGIDPMTNQLAGDSVEKQTEQINRNVDAILHAAGYEATDVIKTVAYLKNLSDFKAFNTVYTEYFTSKPARSCIAAADLLRNAKVVLDVIAYRE